MSHVVIKASVQGKYQTLMREGTKFWLVKPQLGLAHTKNLETLITGTYFTLKPGKGKSKRTFTVLGKAPETMDVRKGLQITLEALLEGGIAFATPEKHSENATISNKSRGVALDEDGSEKKPSTKDPKMSSPSGKPARKGDKFILHDKPEDAWLKWRPVIMLAK